MRPKILEKLQVLDVEWMVFRRETQPVGEAKSLCRSFSRRTTPSSSCRALIAFGHTNGKLVERVRWFPFFKRGSVSANHQKIGGMPRGCLAPGARLVVKLNTGRLIVILQHLLVALHHVNCPQFDVLALKLDGKAHFHARIPSAHIGGAPVDPACWCRGTNTLNGCFRLRSNLVPLAPDGKFLIRQLVHTSLWSRSFISSIPKIEETGKFLPHIFSFSKDIFSSFPKRPATGDGKGSRAVVKDKEEKICVRVCIFSLFIYGNA